MLTPEYLQNVPERMVNLYAQVEADILADMARRISTYDYWIPAAEHQAKMLEEAGMTREDILKRLNRLTGKSQKELKELMQEAGTVALKSADEVYRRAGLNPASIGASKDLQAVLQAGYDKTVATFQNLTQTTARTATQQFERALDRAYMQITTGGFDYNTAVRSAIKQLSADGVGAIRYPSGKVDSIEVAVRRAAITGVNQTALRLQDARAEELGSDLVEVSAHSGARPEHAEWQGEIYSRSGKSKKYPNFVKVTGYGTGAGLGGWNCSHSFRPWFEGMSRTYSKEILEDYNAKKFEYNGKKLTEYEALQEQRKLERNIRRWKREQNALRAAGLDTSEASAKLKDWNWKHKDFLEQTGLKPDGTRLVVGQSAKGLASGKAGDRNASSVIDKVSKFDYSDKKAMDKALRKFAEEKLESNIEHAVVFSPNGKKYEISGMGSTVDITLAGADALKDAVVIHNHPKVGEFYGDCFSNADFKGYFEYGLKELYVTNHSGTYRMKYDGKMTSAEARETYKAAFEIVRSRAFENDGVSLDYEQYETMKVLKEKLEHLLFERVK